MRDRMLGRWIARLVVTVGASAAALGISSVAAHASDYSPQVANVVVSHVGSTVTSSGVDQIPSEPIFVALDYGWS